MADTITPPVTDNEPVKSETTPNETDNTQPKETPAPQVDMQGFTTEQLADMKKFIDSNGGWDKIKSKISNPQKVENVRSPEVPVHNDKPVTAPVQAPKMAEGYISQKELMTLNYFKTLASDEQYEPIKDLIVSGEMVKELTDFGISITDDNGNFNDHQIRKYLALKSASIPKPQANVLPTDIPTNDYVDVDEGTMDYAKAKEILEQNTRLRAEGKPLHPSTAKANEIFIKHAFDK